jgi:hypothetical protein
MAKKKKTKKRIISNTEKKLRNQRRYQIDKRNKVRKNLNKAVESIEKLKGKKVGKNIIYEIPKKIKKELGITKTKYTASKQTIINAYYQKIYKINNIVNEKETALIKRFKFKQRGAKAKKHDEKNINIPIGFVWNVSENLKSKVFDNSKVKIVNDLDKKTQAPELLDLFESEKSVMGSEEFMSLDGKNGNYIIIVEKITDIQEFENLLKEYGHGGHKKND